MATINFSFKGKDYELMFTRTTVKQMERNGFSINKLEDQTALTIETLFAGSFIAKHKSIKRDLVDEIYSKMPDKEKLLQTLVSMYQETLESLMDEPDESEKLEWTTNA